MRPTTNSKQNWVVDLLSAAGEDITKNIAEGQQGAGKYYIDMLTETGQLPPMLL